MNWTQILKDAGIPDSPGRAEAAQQSAEIQQRATKEACEAGRAAREAHEQRLAAKGDTRKAIRSKVRVGQ